MDFIPVSDSQVTDDAEIARLSAQSQTIIRAFLQHGTLLTDDLQRISRQYSARIADCRRMGWDIECYERDHTTGVCKYRLNSPVPLLRGFTIPVAVHVYGQPRQIVNVQVMAANKEQAIQAARFNAAVVIPLDTDETSAS